MATSVETASNSFDEFEYVRTLGQGSFGKVIQVRNKLDHHNYALKIVKLSQDEEEKKRALRECQQMAVVDHPGIVRYHQSRIIDFVPFKEMDSDASLEESFVQLSLDSEKTLSSFGSKSGKNSHRSDESDDSVAFYQKNSASSDAVFPRYSLSPGSAESSATRSSHSEHASKGLDQHEPCPVKQYLCMTMELCGENLNSFLAKDEQSSDPLLRQLNYLQKFVGIVDAIAFMHNQGLIHRDLKPDNIFRSLKDPNIFKIGDWGSVKKGTSGASQVESNIFQDCSFSAYFGTLGFLAPEVSAKSLYSNMVDIYSLGVILMHLLHPKATQQEYSNIKKALIQGDTQKVQIWPRDLIQILQSTLSEDETKRPPAERLKIEIEKVVDTMDKMLSFENSLGTRFHAFLPQVNDKSKLEYGQKVLESNKPLFLQGPHATQKMSAAINIASLFRQQGFNAMIFDMTNVRADEVIEVILNVFKCQVTQDVRNQLEFTDKTFTVHVNEGFKMFCVFRNCMQEVVSTVLSIPVLSETNPCIKLVFTGPIPSSNAWNKKTFTTITFESEGSDLGNLRKLLPDEKIPVTDLNNLIQHFPQKEQEMLLLLSILHGFDKEDDLMYKIFEKYGMLKNEVLSFTDKLREIGILRQFSLEKEDLHWYLKEQIRMCADHNQTVTAKSAVIAAITESLMRDTNDFYVKDGSDTNEGIMKRQYYYHEIFLKWAMDDDASRIYCDWEKMTPPIFLHIVWYLGVHNISHLDRVLDAFLLLSQNNELMSSICLCLKADNERRLGQYDKAKVSIDQVERLLPVRSSVNAMFVQIFYHHVLAYILSERKAPPDESRNKFIEIERSNNKAIQLMNRLRQQQSEISTAASDIYISIGTQLMSKNCFFLRIQKNIEVQNARREFQITGQLDGIILRLNWFLRFSENLLGNHIDMGGCLKDCADFMLENGRHQDADILYRKANDIYLRAFKLAPNARNAEKFSMLLQNWGKNKCKTGNFQDGLNDFEKSLSIIQKRSSKDNKHSYKAFSRLSQIFYELHVDHGLKALDVAEHLELMRQNRFSREMQNLLGNSIITARQEGFSENLLKDVRFRRWICKYDANRCRRLQSQSCSFAHDESEIRH